ncbi:MAG: type II toxin-antitoxin system PemK/MazF family toxin [Pleurocapsa sp. MO_226.B13]|nr:type II toxin-antitoxin system PemK/MazF family toxin [Pleurocapsa sp. MO_226.B13]
MTFNRGQVWLANLNPTQGSEQSGTRPVIVFQHNIISKFSTTIITVPLTTNLRRAKLPSSLLISLGKGGLEKDSVALCHQLRVIDVTRLKKKLGQLDSDTISKIDRNNG